MAKAVVHEKLCQRCKTVKPRHEFYKRRKTGVAIQALCKPCILQRRKEWDRTAQGKASKPRAQKKERAGIAREARMAVYYGVKYGYIPPATSLPCIRCLMQADQYHHHHGYRKEYWRDVVPLCRRCHTLIHATPQPTYQSEPPSPNTE